MIKHKIPSFMKGTTSWSFLGYFYAQQPTIELTSSETLTSSNPWIVLASILEHAKKGDFTKIPYLRTLFHTSKVLGPDRASIHLTGDAGLGGDLLALQTLLEEGPDHLRAYAAEASVLSGQLWLVPYMLEAWKSVKSRAHHETIGFAISSLLEMSGGNIAAKAGSYRLPADTTSRLEGFKQRSMPIRPADSDEKDPDSFESIVIDRLNELRFKHAEGVALWQGQPVNVRALADQMYNLVRNTSALSIHGLFIRMRHKFEAVTGIDCSECYQNGILQPLRAAALFESIFETGILAQYEPGVRYFFNHRIPT